MKIKSLGFKLVFYGISSVLITAFLLSAVLTVGYVKLKRENLKTDIEQYLKAIAYSIGPAVEFDDISTINEVLAQLEYEKTFVSVKVKSEKGVVYVYEISDHPIVSDNDQNFLFFDIPIMNEAGKLSGSIEARITTQFLIEEAKKDIIKIVYVTLVILFITSLLIIVFARKFVQPIIKLKNSADAIAKEDFSHVVDASSDDEVGQLAMSFNLMTKDLQRFRDELLKSKQYTDSIILNMVDMLIVFDRQGIIKTVNKAMLDSLGYTQDELVGTSVIPLFLEGQKCFDEMIIHELSGKKAIHNLDLVYVTKDLRKIPVNFSASVFSVNDQGVAEKNSESIVGIARDMRQVKELIRGLESTKSELEVLSKNLENRVKDRTLDLTQAQEAMINIMEDLDESKSYIEKIVINLLDMLIVISPDGKIQTINPIVQEILGYTEKDLINNHFSQIFSNASDTKYILEVFNAGTDKVNLINYEINYKKKNGEMVPVMLSASMMEDKDNNPLGVVIIAKDITERKEIEAQLQHAAEEWRATFDSISELVSIQDNDFNLVRVNLAFAHAFGYHPKDIVGKKCHELFHSDGKVHPFCPHRKTLDSGESTVEEYFEPALDKHVEITCSPLKGSKGELIGTVHIAKDITHRKEIEKTQRLTQLGKLVADMAHEVNNPLMVISGRAQLSLMETIENADVKKNLGIITKECQRAKEIIQRLLRFSRPSKGLLKEVNINDTIDEVIELLGHQFSLSNVNIKRKYNKNVSKVLIDEKQIQEVFMNLLNNARDAMEDGGGVIDITTTIEKDNLVTYFSDYGSGMDQDTLTKVFDPFFTTKEKGTGLGLPVCFGIMKAHKGDLRFESAVGKGTTAVVTLPLKKENEDA